MNNIFKKPELTTDESGEILNLTSNMVKMVSYAKSIEAYFVNRREKMQWETLEKLVEEHAFLDNWYSNFKGQREKINSVDSVVRTLDFLFNDTMYKIRF